jgi:hypothetical protein
MSWAGRANNQTISFTDLKDAVDTGVVLGKATITTSNEQVTKSDVDTYTWANTLFPAFANKANNQLVVKSNIQKGCWCWRVQNDDTVNRTVTFTPCNSSTPVTTTVFANGDFIRVCSNVIPTIDTFFTQIDICGTSGIATRCNSEDDCSGCVDCGANCGGDPYSNY